MELENICVQSTMDYDSIVSIQGNRGVNVKNVEKIKESMLGRQLIVPAIVNEQMQLIDGQHRKVACEQLGLPFYYIIVHGYGLKEVQKINANAKTWKKTDYLESYIDLYDAGDTDYYNYPLFATFMKTSELPLPTALALSDLKRGHYKGIESDFIHGTFEFKTLQMAKLLVGALEDIKLYDETRAKQKSFALVFASLFFNSKYKHDHMVKNLARNASELSLMGNKESIRMGLLKIYNRNIGKRTKLYADSTQDDWNNMLSEQQED